MIPALSGTAAAGVRVLIATRPVDFRRGADGLAATVQSVLQQDPFSGTIFVFRSKRADRVKMLVYDGTGLGADLEATGGEQVQMAGDQRRGDAAVGGAIGGVVRGARLAAGVRPKDQTAAGGRLSPASNLIRGLRHVDSPSG